MEDLEATIAAPVPGREKKWVREVTSSLDTLSSAFERHVTETESRDGFLQQLVTDAPRLDPAVARLRRDHLEIRLLIEDVQTRARGAAPGEDPSPEKLRTAALELLGRLARHRQRGADLIYEAYLVDIGTGD
ncbi:MAG TPA: hemerythrin domain-containing protein [Acidimicrobiales bacterium]|nr:hemerythrin domain-containing protein [Acidimicrobiales bacterium]